MKQFPDQEIINAIKAKYNLTEVKIWDEGPGAQNYYYEEGGDGMGMFGDSAEWDENGELIYSDIERIKY